MWRSRLSTPAELRAANAHGTRTVASCAVVVFVGLPVAAAHVVVAVHCKFRTASEEVGRVQGGGRMRAGCLRGCQLRVVVIARVGCGRRGAQLCTQDTAAGG